ncbi:MAG: 3'-5' exonuclease, partial [Alistipes sp.]|nr:3'-5' exonuclease [Alistipes sp.]
DHYKEKLENDIDFLAEFTTRDRTVDYAGRIVLNEKDEEVFSFGKYRGRKVEEVFREEPSYYKWMMDGDFPLYTKKVITDIYVRSRAAK